MSKVVGAKFPESIFTAIGGFIFLRLINPSIVTPSNIDLDLPNDSSDLRRGLVTITKILQALANNIRFGAKEPGMRALNPFMVRLMNVVQVLSMISLDWQARNIYPMTRFLQDISVSCISLEL